MLRWKSISRSMISCRLYRRPRKTLCEAGDRVVNTGSWRRDDEQQDRFNHCLAIRAEGAEVGLQGTPDQPETVSPTLDVQFGNFPVQTRIGLFTSVEARCHSKRSHNGACVEEHSDTNGKHNVARDRMQDHCKGE